MFTSRRQPRERAWQIARAVVLVVSVALLAWAASTALIGGSADAATPERLEGGETSAAARAEGSSPSLGGKLLGYDAFARALGRVPDAVIIGTSRAVQLDPRYITKLTRGRGAGGHGIRTYNAGVSDGAARELLAVGDFVAMREAGSFPTGPHLVVLFDLEALDSRTPTKRVRAVLRSETIAHHACSDPMVNAVCAKRWRAAAAGILAAARVGQKALRPAREVQRPDGMQIHGYLETLDAQGVDLAPARARRIAIRIRSYRPGGAFDQLEAAPTAAARAMIEHANTRGDVPTIVLTAMHPDCLAKCGPAGWNLRHRQVRALFVTWQHQGLRFRLRDFSVPRAWGGSGADFFDEIHLRPAGAAKVVRALNRTGEWDVAPNPAVVVGAGLARVRSALQPR
jgi:hypothetical protein